MINDEKYEDKIRALLFASLSYLSNQQMAVDYVKSNFEEIKKERREEIKNASIEKRIY